MERLPGWKKKIGQAQRNDTGGKFTCAGSSTSYPGRFTAVDINGVALPSGQVENTLGPNGTLIPFTANNLYNYGPLNYYQRPDERYTAGAFLHYEFNEHATVYSQFMYMNDNTTAQIAPGGIFVDLRTSTARIHSSRGQDCRWVGLRCQLSIQHR